MGTRHSPRPHTQTRLTSFTGQKLSALLCHHVTYHFINCVRLPSGFQFGNIANPELVKDCAVQWPFWQCKSHRKASCLRRKKANLHRQFFFLSQIRKLKPHLHPFTDFTMTKFLQLHFFPVGISWIRPFAFKVTFRLETNLNTSSISAQLGIWWDRLIIAKDNSPNAKETSKPINGGNQCNSAQSTREKKCVKCAYLCGSTSG